jgi:type IV secretion system protein VirB2
MNLNMQKSSAEQSNRIFYFFLISFIVYAIAFSSGVMAQTATETEGKVTGFFSNVKTILDAISIIVVTIAIIFAGYQIAFANKRIADVAPILIGGVLIGAASQIAKMLIGTPAA